MLTAFLSLHTKMDIITESDLNNCLKQLESSSKAASDGDKAEVSRMLDVLKQLQKRSVTADLLKRTNAGKRLNKFCKHSVESVCAAAKAAVESWKQCVKQEQQGADNAEAGANGSQDAAGRDDSAPSASRGGQGPGSGGPSGTPRGPSAADGKSSAPGKGGAAEPPALSSARSSSGSLGPFVVDPPRCGNDTRDKVRTMLAESLSVGYTSGSGVQSPNQLAAAIEDALHDLFNGVNAEYKAKARSLNFNLKDAKNPDLRERVLSGMVPPEQLVRLTAEEMASDEQKKKNKELKDFLAKEATRGQNTQASTDMFQWVLGWSVGKGSGHWLQVE